MASYADLGLIDAGHAHGQLYHGFHTHGVVGQRIHRLVCLAVAHCVKSDNHIASAGKLNEYWCCGIFVGKAAVHDHDGRSRRLGGRVFGNEHFIGHFRCSAGAEGYGYVFSTGRIIGFNCPGDLGQGFVVVVFNGYFAKAGLNQTCKNTAQQANRQSYSKKNQCFLFRF